MVLASFTADSQALGAHWIYDMDEIASRYGRVERLLPPPPDSFHAGRTKGSFTHYGDQTMVLLRHLAEHGTFDLASFASEWRRSMEEYDGYADEATKHTLRTLAAGASPEEAGSDSDDLAGAARIGPLTYLFRDDRNQLERAARSQTAFTHNAVPVVETAAFFARVLWNVLNGKTPTTAIASVLGEMPGSPIARSVTAGLESVDRETRVATLEFGQQCSVAAALPLTVHLIAKYEGSLRSALVENVSAGGDSAARGMIVGMVLGAFHGHDAIPGDWIEELRAYREITALLEDLEAALLRNGNAAFRTDRY
jgi:ADP-ribosylglycohydrolase